jgi:CubicO group peptidase (beta-lactamase class C family)
MLKYNLPLFLLLLGLTACLRDEPLKEPYRGFRPNAATGWPLATPAEVDIDSQLLDAAYRLVYRDDRYPMARSLLVVRNGRLVGEAYPRGDGAAVELANIQSCTKSVTAILAGIALGEKVLDSLGQPLFAIMPEFFDADPAKRQLTLGQTLTMRTGLDFDNGEQTQELYFHEGPGAAYVLARPREYAPGTVFRYHDGAPHLVSAAIQRRTGRPLDEYAREKLFDPLGIDRWQWERAPDGTTFGAFSLYLTPRDFARIGVLLAQNGRWNGQVLLDSAYIAAATYPQVHAARNGASYGYYFWIFPGLRGYAALGHGGQVLAVVPEKNLVIAYTAWGYTGPELFDDLSEVLELVVESCY